MPQQTLRIRVCQADERVQRTRSAFMRRFGGTIRCVLGRFIGFGQIASQRSGFGPLVHSIGRLALLRGQRGKPSDNSCRRCFRMSGSESRLLASVSFPRWARFMIHGRTKRVSCQRNRCMFFIGICFRAVPLPSAAHGRVRYETGASQLPPETVPPPFAKCGLLQQMTTRPS